MQTSSWYIMTLMSGRCPLLFSVRVEMVARVFDKLVALTYSGKLIRATDDSHYQYVYLAGAVTSM